MRDVICQALLTLHIVVGVFKIIELKNGVAICNAAQMLHIKVVEVVSLHVFVAFKLIFTLFKVAP